MSLFSRKKEFFNAEEKHRIVEAVREAEQRTSGEIRVFVASRCKYMDAIDEAAEILQSTLDEEKETDQLLTGIAENDINWQAEQEESEGERQ